MSILTNDQKVKLGGIYENAGAQELHARGFSLYYCNSHKSGALDFLIGQDEQEKKMISLKESEKPYGSKYNI